MKLVDLVSVNDCDLKELQSEFRKKRELLHGGNGLLSTNDLENWRKRIKKLEENPPKDNVRTKQFFILTEANDLIGVIDFRYKLLAHQELSGGHIGYSIRESYRKNGYAKLALEMVLSFAKKTTSLDKVLLICSSENLASKKTIISCGGTLEKIIEYNNSFVEHYYIYL